MNTLLKLLDYKPPELLIGWIIDVDELTPVPYNPFSSMDYLLRVILNSSNYGCCTPAQNKDDLLVMSLQAYISFI